MSASNNVSGTAFIIAEFRAEENEAVAPLYKDEIVRLFLNEQTRKVADQIAQTFPQAKEMIKLRTKYFDDVLSQQILQGCEQVVILGSGLDTRAVRKNADGVIYFEIDAQATLQLKAERLRENQITANVRYIPGDYIKDNLIAMLKENKFNFNMHTYFLWEGNTTLLTKENIMLVLKQICENVQTFKLSFDYMSDQVISRTTGYEDINNYIDKYESLYAPWITGFENIDFLAEELNLKVIENFSTAELHRKYRPHQPLDSNLFKFYFVCTLESCNSSLVQNS